MKKLAWSHRFSIERSTPWWYCTCALAGACSSGALDGTPCLSSQAARISLVMPSPKAWSASASLAVESTGIPSMARRRSSRMLSGSVLMFTFSGLAGPSASTTGGLCSTTMKAWSKGRPTKVGVTTRGKHACRGCHASDPAPPTTT